jgi:hypothetical protein
MRLWNASHSSGLIPPGTGIPFAYSDGHPVDPAATPAKIPASAIRLYSSGGICFAWSHARAFGVRYVSVNLRRAARTLRCESL